MVKKYRNDGTIKLLVFLGAIVGGVGGVLALAGNPNLNLGMIMAVLAVILAILTFLSVVRPDNPIPYNGIVYLIFGILFIIFLGLWWGVVAGILLIVAAVLCFVN